MINDIEYLVVALPVVGGLVAYYRNQLYALYTSVRMKMKGGLTMDEIEEIVEDVKELVEDVPTVSELKKMLKADLVALCEKHGVDAKGTKSDLIDRLMKERWSE